VNGGILIAGGGVIGLSIAWRLAQAGQSVTVCEKSRTGGEASWAAAGMLAPGGEFTTRSHESDLAIESRALYPGFVSELENVTRESVDYRECGALELAYSEAELAAIENKAEQQQAALGISSKRVTPANAATFWPRLDASRIFGGRFYPNDAVVNPRELSHALAIACRQLGVSITEQSDVTAIDVTKTGTRVTCGTGTQTYAAAVIAAGAWSSSIRVTGVPALPTTEPVKGHLIAYRQPAQTCSTIIRQGHYYMLQRSNGLLVAGSSMERVGFDRAISERVTNDLAVWAGSVLPHLAETTPTTSWVGFRPAAETLYMGPWHSDRLLLAYGHFRNGILLAPLTALRISEAAIASLGTQTGARV
jgi:glycine oxidase